MDLDNCDDDAHKSICDVDDEIISFHIEGNDDNEYLLIDDGSHQQFEKDDESNMCKESDNDEISCESTAESVSNNVIKYALKTYMKGMPLMLSNCSIRDSP